MLVLVLAVKFGESQIYAKTKKKTVCIQNRASPPHCLINRHCVQLCLLNKNVVYSINFILRYRATRGTYG